MPEGESQVPASERGVPEEEQKGAFQIAVERWADKQREKHGAREDEPIFKAAVRKFWERHFSRNE